MKNLPGVVLFRLSSNICLKEVDKTTGSHQRELKDNRVITVQNDNTYVFEHKAEKPPSQGPSNCRQLCKIFQTWKGQ